MTKIRRSDYDVTNSVQVSSPTAVSEAVLGLLAEAWPGEDFSMIPQAFRDFERLFGGEYPGYLGCDTVYHDIQHTLDMTLAMARLLAGYERSPETERKLGAYRAKVGLITSLFHDAGYIRKVSDRVHRNGAEFTVYHVSRSADFLASYLPSIGFAEAAPLATKIVHFTGFEVQFSRIELDDPEDLMLGHLLGTADLMAQTADRCYLEKCRDRLYPEFVLAGVALRRDANGQLHARYNSGQHLLSQTPVYYQRITRKRLDQDFNRAYRYLEVLFDGENPYMREVERNLEHLARVLEDGSWELLRRHPPCFTWANNPVENITRLAEEHIAELAESDPF